MSQRELYDYRPLPTDWPGYTFAEAVAEAKKSPFAAVASGNQIGIFKLVAVLEIETVAKLREVHDEKL